ncbi:zinc finger protein 283 [Culex quinquefasciatus]|uniref:Zinc finger protein 283 n=1 Tax=Culex quinquefasciatus TaxID=7176 RepID=B0X7D4_CULQU|nr:zinc finger protein 283 [Culex quinquefasciatus]|eukprot:XP_001865556.1 zinc finger protein 283 [Culex quinquefasciatus]
MAKQKTQINSPNFLCPLSPEVTQATTVPEPTATYNLTEPLLEIFKEEPQLEIFEEEPILDFSIDALEPLNEVILEPKLEASIPHDTDPFLEVGLFCSLCLRPCTSDQVVDFSANPSGRDKLALLLGVEIELEQSARQSVICRSCWTMVETFVDFREGCRKAAAWRSRFALGLDGVGDDWLSKDQQEAMDWTRKMVQERVERIEMAEVEARNRQDLGANELSEKKLALKDERDCVEDASCPDSPEGPPKKASPSETNEWQLAVKLHTCSVCSANFTNSYHLREHRNKHLGIKPYECRKGNCNKRFHVYNQRAKHERKCKGKKSLNASVDRESSAAVEIILKVYPCSKCPRKFDTKAGFVTHNQKCKGPVESPPLSRCSICSMEFRFPKKLEAHMNKHNGIKPFKCRNDSCDKHFYGKVELKRHAEFCGKDKPICPLCGLQLSSRGGLYAHLKIHAGEPVAECDTCGKKFKSKKSLTRHQLVHSDERNYPCGECGKALKSANALTVHRRIHTKEKPFGCVICGQAFAYKCLVKPHMKKCHAGED